MLIVADEARFRGAGLLIPISLEPWKYTRISDGPGQIGAMICMGLGRAAQLEAVRRPLGGTPAHVKYDRPSIRLASILEIIMPTTHNSEVLWNMIRSKTEHEASWIQHQVSWHLATNAFLFSAYAVLVISATSSANKLSPASSVLILLAPIVGTLFSTFVYIGVIGAIREIGNALREWDALGPDSEARNKLPAIHMGRSALRLSDFASTGISLTAIAMWLVLLAVSVTLVFGNGSR